MQSLMTKKMRGREKRHSSPGYALQMDVSTLGRNCYMQEDAFMRIFCLPLPERETAPAKYGDLHNFMEKNRIPWEGWWDFA